VEAGASAEKEQLKTCDVVGIKNHGYFSLGRDLHEAASRLEVLEESARIFLAGREVGRVSGLREEDAKRVRKAYLRE